MRLFFEQEDEKIATITLFARTTNSKEYAISITPMGPYSIDMAVVETEIYIEE